MIPVPLGLLRHYPFYKGRGGFVYHPLVRNQLQALPQPTRARLYDGQTIYLNPRDYIDAMVYLYGDFDPAISWCLRRLLRAGDVYVDVGANIGTETVPAAKLVGPTGVVHAFEPNAEVLGLLERSLQANGLTNVQAHLRAVSDFDGEIGLSVPESSSGLATASKEVPPGGLTVEAVRLDGFEPLRTRTIRLLKIDVEGHEYPVLKGAERLLAEGRVEHVLIEIWPDEGVTFDEVDVVRFLRSFGYVPAQLHKRWSLFPELRPVEHSRVERSSCDFLFSKASDPRAVR